MSIIILQNKIVHYEVIGRGRPVIFLHGWIGSWRYWVPAMQSVSTSYRAYAVDLYGYGDTAKSVPNYTLERQVDLIHQFINKLGITRIILVGHGLGAVIAVLFANKYTHRMVDRVMAIGLPNGPDSINPRLQRSNQSELNEWLINWRSEGNSIVSEAKSFDQRAMQIAIADLQFSNLLTTIHQIDIPCLLIYGKQDPTLDGQIDHPRKRHPEPTHQINFNQSGYFPMIDNQNEFNRLLIDFIALSPGASLRQLRIKKEWKRRVR